jgi:hypothetical protein
MRALWNSRADNPNQKKGHGMRAQRIVLGLALLIAATGAASSEEYRGTWEQQMACTPDVWRLCSDQIPDVNRIVTCLRQNTPQLSNGCRAVFESSNSVPQQDASRAAPAAPRARTAPSTRQQPAQPQSAQPRAAQPAPSVDDE